MNSVEIKKDNSVTYVNIKNKCFFTDYVNAKRDSKVGIYVPYDNMIFLDDITLDRQKIFIIKGKNHRDYVTLNHDEIIISDKKDNIDSKIYIDRKKNKYIISKTVFDKDKNIISEEEFISDDSVGDKCPMEKKEALKLASNILERVCDNDLIRSNMLCYNVFDSLNLVSNKNYYPVITNGNITLSWPFRQKEKDISIQECEMLDIILNNTRERVGEIDFCFKGTSFELDSKANSFTYDGNVSYSILEEFRGKGYATEALGLLRDLLKDNCFSVCNDLFISCLPSNIISQKVALKNNGILFYEGKVPTDDTVYSIDGIEEVKVYKITL